jgi:hypothetical protein
MESESRKAFKARIKAVTLAKALESRLIALISGDRARAVFRIRIEEESKFLSTRMGIPEATLASQCFQGLFGMTTEELRAQGNLPDDADPFDWLSAENLQWIAACYSTQIAELNSTD